MCAATRASSRTVLYLIHRFGLTATACAAVGCANDVRPPMRVVLYNGHPGHGDTGHCRHRRARRTCTCRGCMARRPP
jgi:hypothetical protein